MVTLVEILGGDIGGVYSNKDESSNVDSPPRRSEDRESSMDSMFEPELVNFSRRK